MGHSKDVLRLMTTTSLQNCMHHGEDKGPIHGCPVDILKVDRWTWCAIRPADMSTHKALYILCSRQFFHKRHCTPDADNPLGHAPCCVIHGLLYWAT